MAVALYFSEENATDMLQYLRIKGELRDLVAEEYSNDFLQNIYGSEKPVSMSNREDRSIVELINLMEVQFSYGEERKTKIYRKASDRLDRVANELGLFQTTIVLLKKDVE